MHWLEMSFTITHEASELFSDYLTALGSLGLEIEDRDECLAFSSDLSRPDLADDVICADSDSFVRIKAYFSLSDRLVCCNRNPEEALFAADQAIEKAFLSIDAFRELICEKLKMLEKDLPVGPGYQSFQIVKEEDWAENWKQYYQTLHLTPRIVINPSWLEYQPAEGERVISLDPGCAFGTGYHETTALCAILIDDLLRCGDHVLDLGCGSGILAILAAKLGAGSVEAIDIDPLAVQVAKENCRLNQTHVAVHAGELKDALEPAYDLIVANLIADTISSIMPQIPDRLTANGLFIASGIILEKREQVECAAREAGLKVVARREKNDWCALVMR